MEKTKSRIANNPPAKGKRPQPLVLYLIGGAVLLAGLIAVVLAVAANNQQSSNESPVYSGIPAEWQNRNILGDPNAPVTVQAWEDFRCPACAAFNQRVKPGLVENYISAGKVKLEFHHLPLQQHEPGASLAAQAAECAADQGLFWSYHDRVFQETSNGPTAFIAERLIDYAVELNLDKSAFTQCLMSQTHLSTVTESLQAAQAAGFSGTPSVLVDGILIDNPFDFAVVSASIDTLLSEGH
jgi:protein-disulfide isomerase